MRSCRWGGVRRASGREMGSGAARVGGADPGARGGRTRGTLKRRTGCPGSAPRCAARPIPPHPRRPPPSALDFNPFKTKKIPSRPGGGHGKPFYVCLRRLGVPPRPPLTEMEDRRATVTDALQSTTFRLYSSAAAPVTGAAAPRHPLPRCQGTKCRPGTPGILKYVIRSGSFLRKGIELSNTVS